MIVKVNKKGVVSDCGCNKKLAKGGCAPKKKKIKKNKNGGYLALDMVPSYRKGEKILTLSGNQLFNEKNTPVYYTKKWDEPGINGEQTYEETVVFNPMKDIHGKKYKDPFAKIQVRYNEASPMVADTLMQYGLSKDSKHLYTIPKMVTAKDSNNVVIPNSTVRNPVWSYFVKSINNAKNKK